MGYLFYHTHTKYLNIHPFRDCPWLNTMQKQKKIRRKKTHESQMGTLQGKVKMLGTYEWKMKKGLRIGVIRMYYIHA